MKRLIGPSVVLLSLGVPLFGRIGETMDEAVQRYGKIVHHGTLYGEELYSFNKNGFYILAHFHNGKIDHILYRHAFGGELTPEEIYAFLKANNSGRPMKEELPNLWIGKGVSAAFSKWPTRAGLSESAAWHLDIKSEAYQYREMEVREAAEKKRKEAEKAKLQSF
jgi:hypothetical protein